MYSYNLLSEIIPGMTLDGNKRTGDGQVRIYKNDVEKDFERYAHCYLNAGNKIAEYLIDPDNKKNHQLDIYIFPLVFCYRHSLELIMKAIAFQCIIDTCDRRDFLKNTFHNLEKIFLEIQQKSTVIRKQEEKEWLLSFLQSIGQIDRDADSFRYPFHISITKDVWGTYDCKIQRVIQEKTEIDIGKLKNKFNAAFQILYYWYQDDSKEADLYKNLSTDFLEGGGGYHRKAVVGYEYCKDDFFPYTEAYCETAGYIRFIMEDLFENKKYHEAEGYFLPMCYLYRNCIELAEKAILFEETSLSLPERCIAMKTNKHSICGLWNSIEKYAVGRSLAKQYSNKLHLLENYLKTIHKYDPQAIQFRYPINKEVQPIFLENKRFDFFTTSQFFEMIINTLSWLEDELAKRRRILANQKFEYLSIISENWN